MRIDADLNNAIREYGRQVEFSRSSRTQEGSTVARLNLGNRKYIDEQYEKIYVKAYTVLDLFSSCCGHGGNVSGVYLHTKERYIPD